MKTIKGRAVLYFIIFITGISLVKAENYQVSIKLETGFVEMENAIVSAKVDFGKSIKNASMSLILQEDNKSIPCYFKPEEKFKGTLYWQIPGKLQTLTDMEYILKVSDGNWQDAPSGSKEIEAMINSPENKIPNASFEDETKISSNQKNNPEWNIYEVASVYKKLPDLKSSCRLSDKETHDGKKCLEFTGEYRTDTPNGNNQPVCVSGFATSSFFPLKEKTKYTLSYYIKITDFKNTEELFKEKRGVLGISVCVYFLDKNQKKFNSKEYPSYRMQVVYPANKKLVSDFMNKWVKVEGSAESPPGTVYGQITIYPIMTGTIYIDELSLNEAGKEQLTAKAGKLIKEENK
ncbi:MAG: hypothetical protein A2017_11630 [Lentisphaerae bacterium GWF2_44_16]|nr:MAG: hypothetical protein A2017_11630 [Lentisphaerae bacterium GWF2_44_16]